MGGEQDRAAGRLVHAARFHADVTVLDQIEPADPIVVTEVLSVASSVAGLIALPLIATGSPFSNAISTTVGLSGADSGSTVRE